MSDRIDLLTGKPYIAPTGGWFALHGHRSCTCGHRHAASEEQLPDGSRRRYDERPVNVCRGCPCTSFTKASA